MFDLVLAVIIRLKMFHIKSIIRRTNSTKMEHMTDLEVKIRDSNILKNGKIYTSIIVLHNKLFKSK